MGPVSIRPRSIAPLLIAVALLATSCASSIETADERRHTTDVPSGQEAILAAQGEPHILWFWGPN